jgi:hypothetical protein
MTVQHIQLALGGCAHGAARTIHDVRQLGPCTATQLEEFGKTGLEDALHAHAVVAAVGVFIQAVQVGPAPEIALELVAVATRGTQYGNLVENQRPRQHRHQGQACHDQLHHQAGIHHQAEYGNLLHDVSLSELKRPSAIRGRW